LKESFSNFSKESTLNGRFSKKTHASGTGIGGTGIAVTLMITLALSKQNFFLLVTHSLKRKERTRIMKIFDWIPIFSTFQRTSRRRVSYDHDKFQADIFWDVYTRPKDEDGASKENQDESNEANSYLATLWKSIYGFFYNLVLTYNITGYIDKKSIKNQKLFLKYFLNDRKKFALILSGVNLGTVFIIVAITIIRAYLDRDIPDDFQYDIMLMTHVLIWSIFSFLCFGYFLVSNYFPQPLLNSLHIDLYEAWSVLGSTILIGKIFTVVTRFVRSYLESNQCYSFYLLPNHDTIRSFIVPQTIFDLYQTSVFALMPFHWTWIFTFSLIQYIEDIYRIHSCISEYNHSSLRTELAYGVIITISLYFAIMVFFLVFNMQMTSFSSFKVIQDRNKIGKQKMKLINLLCRDVKLSALKHQQIFRQFLTSLSPAHIRYQRQLKLQQERMQLADDSKESNSESDSDSSKLLSKSEKRRNRKSFATEVSEEEEELYQFLLRSQDHTSSINNTVNDIVFLVKLGEGRFEFVYSDSIHLPSTFDQYMRQMSVSLDKNEFHLPDFFTITSNDLPNYTFKSHLICFRLLLCSSINIIYSMWKHSYLKYYDEVGEQALEEAEKISLCCRKVSKLIDKKENITFVHLLFKFEFNDPGKFNYPVFINETDNEELKSLCLVCKNIVNTFRGVFNVSSTGVEFTIPADIERDDTDEKKEVAEEKKSSTKEKAKNKDKIEQIENVPAVFFQFLVKEACLYISDPAMESLAMDAIIKLCGSENCMDIYKNQLSLKGIEVYSLIFIQSVDALNLLTHLKYKGKVVLLSEQLLYLNDLKKMGVSYGLLLPSNMQEIKKLKSWLLEFIHKHEKRKFEYSSIDNSHSLGKSGGKSNINPSVVPSVNEIRSQEFIFPQAMEYFKNEVRKSNFFISPTLPSDIRPKAENFVKWKTLLTVNNGLVRTLHLDVIMPIFLFFHFLLWRLGVCRDFNFKGFLLFGMMAWFRGYIHDFVLKPLRISLLFFFRIWVMAVVVVMVLAFFSDFVHITQEPGLTLSFYQVTYPTYQAFLTSYDNRGLQISFTMVNTLSYSRYFAELMPWPLSFFMLNLLTLRALSIFIIYYSSFLDFFHLLMGAMFFICFYLIFTVILYYNQNNQRNEFRSIHQLILSDDFYDRCLFFAKDLVFTHVHKNYQIEENFMILMKRILMTKNSPFTKQQYSLLLNLQLNYKKITRILFLMKYTQNKKCFQASKETFLFDMKATLLFPFLSQICSLLLYENNYFHGLLDLNSLFAQQGRRNEKNDNDGKKHDNLLDPTFPVQIFIRIHPQVTLIRISRDLLLTTIMDLCSQALLNIQKTIQDDNRQELINHQVLLWIQPSYHKEILRFNEIRELEVIVLDTSYLGYSAEELNEVMKSKNWKEGLHPDNFENSTKKKNDGEVDDEEDIEEVGEAQEEHLLRGIGLDVKDDNPGEPKDWKIRGKTDFLKLKRQKEFLKLFANLSNEEKTHLFNERKKLSKQFQQKQFHSIQVMQTHFHSLSEAFNAYFQFSPAVSLSECGFLSNHFQYHSYYKITLPYLLCSSTSYDLELAMQSEKASVRQFFPPSLKSLIQYHILYNQKKFKDKESLKVTTGTPTSLHEKNHEKLYSTTSPSKVSAAKKSPPMKSTTNTNSNKNNGGAKSRNSTHSDSDSSSNNPNSNNGSNAKNKGFIGSVAMFYNAKRETYYVSKEVVSAFALKDWNCSCHSYSTFVNTLTAVVFPDKSNFLDNDIIMLEHVPVSVHNNQDNAVNDNSSNSSPTHGSNHSNNNNNNNANNMVDLRNFIHYIRAMGSQALIVVIYASYVKIPQDHLAYCLHNPNEYTDAASADLHLFLPWKAEYIQRILSAWEKKFFSVLIK
jgi:hypothetical protein